ncbi:MAG: carboxypeptidase-like regulatory domain-containing protein, partial [Polyangiaceae bacterium]|nr:carboxypeptidase-like regulatory domain-containing protein [Polyangiaceae bacterium]
AAFIQQARHSKNWQGRGRSSRYLVFVRAPWKNAGVYLLTLLQPIAGQAQEPPAPDPPLRAAQTRPGLSSDSLPGVINTHLPIASGNLVAVAAEFDYGYYNQVGDLNGSSQQIGGKFAFSWTPIDYLALGASLDGALQTTRQENESRDSSYYGVPRLSMRTQLPVASDWHVGAHLDLEFFGARAPSIDWGATTPTLTLLSAWTPVRHQWLALELGFRFDNSSQTVTNASTLRTGDKLLLGASSSNSIPLNLGYIYQWRSTEFLLEYSGRFNVGKNSVPFGQSPMLFSMGARQELLDGFMVRGDFAVSPSAKVDPWEDDQLYAVAPRFALTIGLSYEFGRSSTQQRADSEIDTESQSLIDNETDPEAKAAALVSCSGLVVDEGGRPLPDTKVTLIYEAPVTSPTADLAVDEQENQDATSKPSTYYTDANGRFVFEDLPQGRVVLQAETPGFEDRKHEIQLTRAIRDFEIVLHPAVPEGQVRGSIRDYQGRALKADLVIQPGNHRTTAAADGSFKIDLPPGRYTVRISHPRYGTQVRNIKVEEKGVFVLNIALQK